MKLFNGFKSLFRKRPKQGNVDKITIASLVITLGIVYGDIGTSPLYVMKAIGAGLKDINEHTIFGAISCIFWTLTLQTTIKYVYITLRADNRGEGGIFALFALIRKRAGWAYFIALIGGCTLLADGIITPSITVTSSIEGLLILYPDIYVEAIVIGIITILFFMQQFGTSILGKSFGPIMFLWFLMLGTLGISQIVNYPTIFAAFNPKYAILLLTQYPGGFLILGAVFLATTGAEALYSDLGHCGIRNIRISWVYVKIALLLNYLGQGAWILNHPDFMQQNINPFYAITPSWFTITGIALATMAAIIASQALISGSFTLISEAISLNFWPKLKIFYPTEKKGQMYIPKINWFLWLSCILVVLYFQESSKMEAAYGLSITITMLMTTFLLSIYLQEIIGKVFSFIFMAFFFSIEFSFLLANLTKFSHGGWFTILIASAFAVIMYCWYNGRKIKNSFISFMRIVDYIPILSGLGKDETIPKFATNLVYITKANFDEEIESKIIYSIINKQPKRADLYWFLHLDIMDDPYTFEYEVVEFVPGFIFKINFKLGFKIDMQVKQYFMQVLEEMIGKDEVDITTRYPSLKPFNIQGDFKFVLIERIAAYDRNFSNHQKIILRMYDMIKRLAIPEVKALNLDATNVLVEKIPIGNPYLCKRQIKRVLHSSEES